MATRIFQSYIIVGDKKQTQDKVENLLDSLGIKIGVSPDITITVPEKSISIGQIREIKSSIFQKPFVLKYKINIIREAEKLTTEAQNALLKIFEEPPNHAIIILETANPKNLLLTLKSRAIVINTIQKYAAIEHIATKNLKQSLLSVPDSGDPVSWIDNQISSSYQLLKKEIDAGQDFIKITKTIENYKEAKQMLTANVNPKFVLSNAILNTSVINLPAGRQAMNREPRLNRGRSWTNKIQPHWILHLKALIW